MVRSKSASPSFTGRSSRIGRAHSPHFGPCPARARSTRFSRPQNWQGTVTRRLAAVAVSISLLLRPRHEKALAPWAIRPSRLPLHREVVAARAPVQVPALIELRVIAQVARHEVGPAP